MNYQQGQSYIVTIIKEIELDTIIIGIIASFIASLIFTRLKFKVL